MLIQYRRIAKSLHYVEPVIHFDIMYIGNRVYWKKGQQREKIGPIMGYCEILAHHYIIFLEYTRFSNRSKYVALIIHFETIWAILNLF